MKEYINPIFFGKLFLLPDNNIYLNFHEKKPIANNNDDFLIQDVLHKAITQDNNWRLTRSKAVSCVDCVATFICPPISNYELVFNKYKICNK
jgi:pseudo-rSAM protein